MSRLAEAAVIRAQLRALGAEVRPMEAVLDDAMGAYVEHERERLRVLQSSEAERVLGARRPTV